MKMFKEWLLSKESGLIEEVIQLVKEEKVKIVNAMTLSSLDKEKQKELIEQAKTMTTDELRNYVNQSY